MVSAGSSPATVEVTDQTTGSPLQVVVTITGAAFSIAPVDSSVTLTDASWCLKASTSTQSGSGTSGGNATITNKKGVLQDIGYLTVYSVTSQATWPAPQCWGASNTGEGDLLYVGPVNTVGDGYLMSSTDGSCTGDRVTEVPVVQAPDGATAAQICRTSGFGPVGTGAYLWQNEYPGAPADAWNCVYE